MKWFGESWGAPVCDGEQVPVPVGDRCFRCGDAIEARESGVVLPFGGAPEGAPPWAPYHKLCLLASVLPVTVHRLVGGRAVCGFSGEVPGRWPHLHFWSDRRSQVNCEGCVAPWREA